MWQTKGWQDFSCQRVFWGGNVFFNVLERQMQVLRSSWKVSSTRFVDMTVCMPTDFFSTFFLFETLLSHRLDREGAIGLTCEKTWFFYCLWGVWGNVITHKKCVNSHFFGFWHIFFINGSACFQEEEEAQLNNFVQICVRYVKNLPYWVFLFKFCYKTIKIIE